MGRVQNYKHFFTRVLIFNNCVLVLIELNESSNSPMVPRIFWANIMRSLFKLRLVHNIVTEFIQPLIASLQEELAKSIEAIGANIFNKIPSEIKASKHQHAFKWTLKCHLRKEKFLTSCFNSTFSDLKFWNHQNHDNIAPTSNPKLPTTDFCRTDNSQPITHTCHI